MNKRRFLLYFFITMMTLAIICAAILLLVSIKRAIKTHAKELTFEENIEAMIKEHRLMADRLIKNWEHRMFLMMWYFRQPLSRAGEIG